MVRATVGMGEPIIAAEKVPVLAPGHDKLMDYPLEVKGHTFEISCMSMGNPHAVAFVGTPVDDLPLWEIGPLVENNPMFPQRVNFEIVNVIDDSHLKARIWERGSGQTEACGTGACAIGVIARLKGIIGDDVTVSLPGGDLSVRWSGEGDVILEGPVQEVFEGEWPE